MWIFRPGTWISIRTWRVQSPSSPPTDSMLLLTTPELWMGDTTRRTVVTRAQRNGLSTTTTTCPRWKSLTSGPPWRMSFITRRWRCYHPISDNISESPPRKETVIKSKINFIEWTSADTIIISSNCLKLTKSFEYYQVDSFGIFTCDRLYVQYFVWLNHVTRYIYVYRSFKWWEFFHQLTFCAIIPSHQIVGTYQYKRTCMSTCISGESLQPEILY